MLGRVSTSFSRRLCSVQFQAGRAFSTASQQDQAAQRLEILAAALVHVPTEGWSKAALARGAVDVGLPAASHGIFARGPVELVEYFMEESCYATARAMAAEQQEAQQQHQPLDSEESSTRADPSHAHTQQSAPNHCNEGDAAAAATMTRVIELRLQQLEPYLSTWPQAMAMGLTSGPTAAATTVRNVALLADEMCHAAGLVRTDARWYTDRAVMASVYGAAELMMLTDKSPGFSDTKEFVRRRVTQALALVDPNQPSKVDAVLLKLLPKGAIPTALAESASALVSASTQAFLGALSAWAPAGATAHNPRTYHDAAPPPSSSYATTAATAAGTANHTGAAAGSSTAASAAGGAYPSPREDDFATAAEAAEFAPSTSSPPSSSGSSSTHSAVK